MEPHNPNQQRLIWIALLISLGWIGLSFFGFLDGFKNLMMDARFKYRGPIESPQKIVYVNRDSDTTAYYGQYLFSREAYAHVADAVLGLGEAKSVFFDFVLSEYSFKSKAVSLENLYKDTVAMKKVVQRYPDQVILASLFSDNIESWILEEDVEWNSLEDFLEKSELDSSLNPLPELPTIPIWQPPFRNDGKTLPGWGQIGLINYGVNKGKSAVVRYVPAYVEVDNHLPYKWMARQMSLWQETEFVVNGLEGVDITLKPNTNPVTKKIESYTLFDEDFPLQTIDVGNGANYYTASIKALLGGIKESGISITKNSISVYDASKLLYHIPLIDGKLIEVNYFSPWINIENIEEKRQSALASGRGTQDLFLSDPYNPMVSFLRVITQYLEYQKAVIENDEITAGQIKNWFTTHFKDSIVLAGPTDPILKDVGPTPFEAENIPYVSAHGNLIKTIVTGKYINRFPDWVEWGIIVVLTLVVSFLAITGGTRSFLSKLVAALVLIFYVYISLYYFRIGHWVIPLISPVASALTSSAFMVAFQLITEEKQKNRIKGLFGTYVSPELVKRMVEAEEEPQLGGHTESITAFFSDIESFSTFSEKLPPKDLVAIMNEYLDCFTGILEEQGGTLDKYIGDAIVGIFGAPVKFDDHAYRSCMAAYKMQLAQGELCERWRVDRPDLPELIYSMKTRIGLNSGEAIVGNMGSSKRFNYTMMGDSVNLAARNESAAKSYGVYAIASESTKLETERQCQDFLFRHLDKIVVKGRSEPVSIYEIFGKKNDLTKQETDCYEVFSAGIKAYFVRDFKKAIQAFERSSKLERNQLNGFRIKVNPSELLLKRSRSFLDSPPPQDWDGRYVMTTK